MEIGFVGLGNLGTPIAENILEKNQRLFVPFSFMHAVVCAAREKNNRRRKD